MPWHPDGAGEKVVAQRSCAPQVWKQQRHARYQKQRQWWLGTKWESRALVSALCRSVLLTCARASAAETRKCPGGGDVDAFLGVKGSPVQIRPSRRFFERLYPELGTKTAMIVPN
jgi:hypothetical protein